MYIVLYAVLPSWSVALGFIALLVIGTVGLLWWASGEGPDPLEELFVPLGLVPCADVDGSGRTHFQGMWRGQAAMIVGRPPEVDEPIKIGRVVISGAALAVLLLVGAGSGSGTGGSRRPPPVPARVYVSGLLPAGLKVTVADMLSVLGAWLGVGQDITIGDRVLDERLVVRGEDEGAVRALLMEPYVRAALLAVLAHRDRYHSLVIDEAGASILFDEHPERDDVPVLDALAALGEALERRCTPLQPADPLAAFDR